MIVYNYEVRKCIICEKEKKGGNGMKYMMTADDIAEEAGVSKGKAYKLIKDLNQELAAKGYIVIAGKLPRAFWETKFFGYNSPIVETNG